MPNLTPVLFFQEHQAQAVFNQTEDYVMFPDEATTSLCVWDSRNASRKQLLSLGHNGPVNKYYIFTRKLGARWAPISSWWHSATLLALRACLTSSFTPFGHSSRVLRDG